MADAPKAGNRALDQRRKEDRDIFLNALLDDVTGRKARTHANVGLTFQHLTEAAVKAPSSHNSQPWLFEPTSMGLRLRADRTRRLPINDPRDRELVISGGAALLHIRIAAANAGHAARVQIYPDPGDADILAEVRTSVTVAPDQALADLADLADAIDERYTCRGRFRRQSLPAPMRQRLADAAAEEGARLTFLDEPHDRALLAELVAAGARAQFADRLWRQELTDWMHPRPSRDGLDSPGAVGRAIIRHLNVGLPRGASDRRRVIRVPNLVILGTRNDDPPSWIAAGQGLERVLLTAAQAGIQAAYFNQPCQVSDLRRTLAAAFPRAGQPQIVIGLGRPQRLRERPLRRRLPPRAP